MPRINNSNSDVIEYWKSKIVLLNGKLVSVPKYSEYGPIYELTELEKMFVKGKDEEIYTWRQNGKTSVSLCRPKDGVEKYKNIY